MQVSIEKLEHLRDVMKLIVRARTDGRKYVPVVLKLEAEIAARKNLDDDYARIIADAA
ncbi:hypothetical protein GCM10011363_07990 [Marivita lacus]|uniref:Uncharacterized protein n=1 Tax=Marivita lacus TaxID=1323742 RepID=A0ABQ1KE09_9RHOB|nr:hypothetical protein [Marivita lacus]GGB93762.1 hypothetical protein GCM10011363_07990 [Marivita lacus]